MCYKKRNIILSKYNSIKVFCAFEWSLLSTFVLESHFLLFICVFFFLKKKKKKEYIADYNSLPIEFNYNDLNNKMTLHVAWS